MYGLAFRQTFSLPNARAFSLTKTSPSSSSLISSKLNLGLGVSYAAEVEGMAKGSVCVPKLKFRDGGGGGRFFFFTTVSVSGCGYG